LRAEALSLCYEGCPFTESEGVFEGFGEAGFVSGSDLEAVLNDMDFPREFFEVRDGVGTEDLLVEKDAKVALGVEKGKEILGSGVFGNGNGKENEDGLIGVVGLAPFENGGGSVRMDGFAGGGMIAGGESGIEELEVVVDLGEGADGRTSGANGVFLLDGNGGRNAVDAINLRLVHAVEELTDVGREGLDVATLALGVEGVEGQGGFSAAGGTGDDGEFADRDVEIEILKIVLPGTSDADGILSGSGGIFRHGANLAGNWEGASRLGQAILVSLARWPLELASGKEVEM